jgi:hypothetical protein
MLRGEWSAGLNYLLNPVSIVRYFEFPFVLSCLPARYDTCLDVSSPRLFSLYVASRNPAVCVTILNPDGEDLATTQAVVLRLGLSNVVTRCGGVSPLAGDQRCYDCIWSISVIEHIAGGHDDGSAVRLLYERLNPGGRLILTVPVDRAFTIEYRDQDNYGTQPREADGRYFFARHYDRRAIWERLLMPLGREPSIVRWFGETAPGIFTNYTRRWMTQGLHCVVEDPREIVDHYREFGRWEDMPGAGVCGLMIEKPHQPEA